MLKRTFLIIACLAALPNCDWSSKCCKDCKPQATEMPEQNPENQMESADEQD